MIAIKSHSCDMLSSQFLRRLAPRVRNVSLSRALATNGFSVDRSGLIGVKSGGGAPEVSEDERDAINLEHKESMSELAKDLASIIGVKGPISLHEYLGQCSNHVLYGYYQTEKEKIGSRGDFTTAPEVSQLFGEALGMWALSHWMALGEPEKINIVELGPGKGTLMKDVLAVAARFPKFEKAIAVSLVELSESMRDIQRAALKCPVADIPLPEQSKSKVFDAQEVLAKDKEAMDLAMKERRTAVTMSGVPINWYYTLNQVSDTQMQEGEKAAPMLVLAQEFLDVFPVHQFVYKNGKWLEKLVDVDTSSDSPYHFRVVLSQSPTPAAMSLLGRATGGAFKDGDGIEVSPVALATCEEIAGMVCRSGGAALLIDYGANATSSDSLRGFQEHKTTSVLSMPGLVDTTVDVDFDAIGRVAARRGAKVVGAITQAEFLIKMGIVDRAEQLVSLESTSDEQQYELMSSLRFLVDEQAMGERFKVMTILDPKLQHATSHIGFPTK
jgi:NADH dehydrogenase [ubiquinone] 1 alpha subcomplex assembly factor 7